MDWVELLKEGWVEDSRCTVNPPALCAGGLPVLRSFSSEKENWNFRFQVWVYWLQSSYWQDDCNGNLLSDGIDSRSIVSAVGRRRRVRDDSDRLKWKQVTVGRLCCLLKMLGLKKTATGQDLKRVWSKIAIDWNWIREDVIDWFDYGWKFVAHLKGWKYSSIGLIDGLLTSRFGDVWIVLSSVSSRILREFRRHETLGNGIFAALC